MPVISVAKLGDWHNSPCYDKLKEDNQKVILFYYYDHYITDLRSLLAQ